MEKKNIYTVDFYINKYEATPEKKWCVGQFIKNNGVFKQNQYCAQGLCLPKETLKIMWLMNKGRGSFNINEDRLLGQEYISLITLFGGSKEKESWRIASTTVGVINNGGDPRYQQPTPKQRILAALRDIKKLQEKSTPSEPKEEPAYRFVEKHESIKPLLEKEIIYS